MSKQGANPEIYNYTPDDDLLVQFSGSRLRELTTQIGEKLEPSIWLGEMKNVKCVSTTVLGMGFSWDSEFNHLIADSVEYDLRANNLFGLCRAYTTPAVSTTVFPVNGTSIAIHPADSLKWVSGTQRVNGNACRWTDKESAITAPYAFYPMTKLFKGGAVAYFVITALKQLPLSFATYADFQTWINTSSNRWQGSPLEYESVKETYPNVFDIEMYFKCGAQGGQSRSTTACLFYPQNTKCVSQQMSIWDGSEFSEYYNALDPRYAGQKMSYGVIPQGARVINYYSSPYLFKGCYNAKYSSTGDYATVPYGTAWAYLMGLENYRRWATYVTSDCDVKISFCDFPLENLIDIATNLGFAATDSTSSVATNGNIDTNNNIWSPTYDNEGNIDGKSNEQEDKEEYTTDGENGGFIQPNFDPYAEEQEEEYPDENPSEEQETDEVLLPDVTLNSYGVFNRSYVLNKTKAQDLSDYLWNTDSDLFDTIMNDLKLVGDNRMNSIINMMMFPFEIPRGEEMHIIRIGRHNTSVVAKYLDSTNLVFDMGSCYCYAKYRNFLDYEPYTQSWLYVPFCGVFKVPSQQFMNKYIHVKLAVDILTGAGQAIIYAGGIPIFYKNCKVGMQIPVTGADSSYTIKNYIAGTQSALSAIAAAPNNTIGALQSSINAAVSFISAQNAPVESVGSSSPQCGILMPNKAYFICERPKTLIKNVPDYGRLVGYACYKSGLIGEFTGYSKFENVKLDFTNANDYEKTEIKRLLKEGVYL